VLEVSARPASDCDVEITDDYRWKPQDEIKRYEWSGDVIYVPPARSISTQRDPQRPRRLISCTNRIYKNSG